jgi:anti-sigma regulatory factor (Ser/Thr protein kinase)
MERSMTAARPVSLKITLPRIPDIELVAVEGLTRLAAHLGIAEDKIGEARILVTEAIINAFEHAGGANTSVRVEFTVTRERLVIFVRDYGRGFDAAAVPEPDPRRTAGRKRGWGLKLMKTMSDAFSLESTDRGTKITLTKELR